MKILHFMFILLILKITILTASESCVKISISQCCKQTWPPDCPQPHCAPHIIQKCPEKKALLSGKSVSRDLRRAPQQLADEVKIFSKKYFIKVYLAKMWNSKIKLSTMHKQNSSK